MDTSIWLPNFIHVKRTSPTWREITVVEKKKTRYVYLKIGDRFLEGLLAWERKIYVYIT